MCNVDTRQRVRVSDRAEDNYWYAEQHAQWAADAAKDGLQEALPSLLSCDNV